MSIAEKLETIATKQQEVWDAGELEGYNNGYDIGHTEGYDAGKKAEWDRFWDAYQDKGNRVNYRRAFGGGGWVASGLLPPKYPMVLGTGVTAQEGMFQDFGIYTTSDIETAYDLSAVCAMIDFSKCNAAKHMFSNAIAKNITCDFSNLAEMNNTFAGGNGGVVDNITLKVTDKTTSYTNAFYYQMNLKEIRFTEDSVIAGSIDFRWSPLSKESVDSIMQALSETTTGKTATFKKTAVEAAFTTDAWNALVATKSNWTITLV